MDIENPEAVATAREKDRSSEIIHDLCRVHKKLVVSFNSRISYRNSRIIVLKA